MICVHYIYTQVAPYKYNIGLDISILGQSIIEIETETHTLLCKKRKSWKPSNFHVHINVISVCY
jgi:hypothetical protein